MNHLGITFGGIHSYNDLSLKWIGPFKIEEPEPVVKKKEIAGRDGDLDYSEAVANRICFKNRIFSTDFELETKSTTDYQNKISNIVNKLQGKRLDIILDTDSSFKYTGRITITHRRKNERFTVVTVEMDVFPYKRKITDTVVEMTVSGSADVICPNLREAVVPMVEVSSSMTISFGSGYSKTVDKGKHLLDIVFEEGENVLSVTGNGTITITYREGSL